MSTPADDRIRISDADREAALTALGEHYASGRLTKEEYDDRAASAYAAKTASSLRPLFVDLPPPHPDQVLGTTGARARTSYARPPAPAATKTRRGLRLPALPVLLVLVGVAILIEAPWLVFVGLGLLWCGRSGRSSWGGCGKRHASGRDRAPRGSWA